MIVFASRPTKLLVRALCPTGSGSLQLGNARTLVNAVSSELITKQLPMELEVLGVSRVGDGFEPAQELFPNDLFSVSLLAQLGGSDQQRLWLAQGALNGEELTKRLSSCQMSQKLLWTLLSRGSLRIELGLKGKPVGTAEFALDLDIA